MAKNPLVKAVCYIYWTLLLLNGYTQGADLTQDEVAIWKAEVALHFLFALIYLPIIFLEKQQISQYLGISVILFILIIVLLCLL